MVRRCVVFVALRVCSAAQFSGMPTLLYDAPHAGAGMRFAGAARGFSAAFFDHEVRLSVRSSNLRLRFPGSNRAVSLQPLDRAPALLNFITGSDPALWAAGLHTYTGLIYRNLYPGIDMTWEPCHEALKTEFRVSPGIDPNLIRMAYVGAKSVRVDVSGTLIVDTGRLQIRDAPPDVYAEFDGARRKVPARYSITRQGSIAFAIAPYDGRATLIIDPVLSFSTLLGGSNHDSASGIAVDPAGNAYIAGWTESDDFPATGGLARGAGTDMFVAKFTPGNNLAYCTFLGGSGDDRAAAVAVDAAGNAIVAGSTTSSNMPIMKSVQSSIRGGTDVYVAKLNASGTAITFGTYLGGSTNDSATSVAIDSSGNIYVAGSTLSHDFPVVNAFQSTNRGRQNAFVFKLNPSGPALAYSTYLGGSAIDVANGIAVDSTAAVYVAGATQSADYPTVRAIQSTARGLQTAFVTKLAANGLSLVYSTYLGGSGGTPLAPESANAVAVDASGVAYITGTTNSDDFPVVNALQPVYSGSIDAFVTAINTSGSAILFSTFLGGTGKDWANGIAVDSAGSVYICGYTSSADFPVSQPIQNSNAGLYDAFVAQLSAGVLVAGTYFGGAGIDSADAIAIDSSRNILVAGHTMSADFPLLHSLTAANTGSYGGFLLKISSGAPACAYVVTPNPANVPSLGGPFTLSMNTAANCSWTAAPNSTWLHISAGTGAGGGSIVASADPNPAAAARSGSVSVGGQIAIVNQDGSIPVLGIAQTFTGVPKAGQQVMALQITVSNLSNVSTNGGVSVTATPGAGLTLVSMSGIGWQCSANSCVRGDALAAAASYPVIAVNVNVASNPPAELTSQATVSGGGAADATATATASVASPLGFFTMTPCRVVDTRPDQGKSGAFGPPAMRAYQTRDFPLPDSTCTIPASAQAYSLNFTVVPPGPLDFLSAWSAGQSYPGVSTLNSPAGGTIANAAIVPAGADGAISVVTGKPTDLIVDNNGYFAPPDGKELAFYPLTPCRVADTRASQSKSGAFGPPGLKAYVTRDFPLASSSCGIPVTAMAYSLNLTVVPSGPLGFLSVWPAGQGYPGVSTLNSPHGTVLANAAIVPAGAGGSISVVAGNPTDLIIDVNGYFAPPGSPGALNFYTLAPCRIVDTRASQGKTGSFGPPSLAAYATRNFRIGASACGIPASARAYSLNFTAVPQGRLDFLSAWPAGQSYPGVSTLNSDLGAAVANAAIVVTDSAGGISVVAGNATDLIIDINGYFAP